MAKVIYEATYHPSGVEVWQFELELPEGYGIDDIDHIYNKWINDVWIHMKDGTSYHQYQSGDVIETINEDSDDYKWPEREHWYAI